MALVLGAYAAWERGDIDAAVAAMHPEIVWIEPDEFPMGGERRGPAAVAEYLRASRESWREMRSRRRASVAGGDVVVIHHVEGTLLDGTANTVDVADVFTVRDGVVVRMAATLDLEAPFR
ncbi:nuclear transport factor 2 family protein [Actinomycetospora sp. C-140]